MMFPESKLAHHYLDGLKGIEIGAAAHNPFGLDTINVDRYSSEETMFKAEERELCGDIANIDVVAMGDDLPLPDKSYDFVISSHVVEHFYDPIGALLEWKRVAKKYIFIIVPHKERTFDKDKPVTTVAELIARHEKPIKDYEDKHWSVWRTIDFIELLYYMEMEIEDVDDVDDKCGNGFTVVIKL